jgi:hypothetical protein
MRVERERKKKLIVAFHFLHAAHANANQATAGWKCEQCRRQGLESRRRCGFLPEAKRDAARVVWARGRVATEECPTSFVSPVSIEFIEKYFASKVVGVGELTAREAEAFLVLERELRTEQTNGQR